MSFREPAERELEGQRGSVGHFWNLETKDSKGLNVTNVEKAAWR